MSEVSRHSCYPVRPVTDDLITCIPCNPCMPVRGKAEGEDGWETIEQSHIQQAIGGKHPNELEDIVNADDDEVVQPAVPLPAPIMPSKREVEIATSSTFRTHHGVSTV